MTITNKALNYTGVTAVSKVYDGTTAATFSGNAGATFEAPGAGTSSDGDAYTGDAVSFWSSRTGTFASANVANGIAVTLTGGLTLSGAQAGDYSVGLPNSPLTANITVRTLTVTPDAVSIAYSGVPLNNTTYSDNTGNYTYVGFQNGQNASTAGVSFSGSMAFNGSTATTVEAVGDATSRRLAHCR